VERAVLLSAPPPITRPIWAPVAAWPPPLLMLLRLMFGERAPPSAWPPGADPALVRYEDRQGRQASPFAMRALAAQTAWLDAPGLADLDLPILLLSGAADSLAPTLAAEAVARFLPQSRLEVLEDCGHHIMLERPAETNALLRRFIEGALI
jgi:pimeloyl-ACP methyl ester carboxylesterase